MLSLELLVMRCISRFYVYAGVYLNAWHTPHDSRRPACEGIVYFRYHGDKAKQGKSTTNRKAYHLSVISDRLRACSLHTTRRRMDEVESNQA
jgi:hypothetical protein